MGKRIKELRTTHNLTQEQLGEMLGVKKAPIQKYESSEIVNIKIDTIKKLCKIFSVSPNYLIGFSDRKTYSEYEKETAFSNLLHHFLGENGKILIKNYAFLNEKGREKIVEYLLDILKIEEHNKKIK